MRLKLPHTLIYIYEIVVIYLDDIFFISDDEKDCARNIRIVQELLESLGLIVNKKKSQSTLMKQCKFLGYILDSKFFCLYLTKEKREKMEKSCIRAVQWKRCCY